MCGVRVVLFGNDNHGKNALRTYRFYFSLGCYNTCVIYGSTLLLLMCTWSSVRRLERCRLHVSCGSAGLFNQELQMNVSAIKY